MGTYIVRYRGIAEQGVYVEADSKAEAIDRANAGQWDDTTDYPDWVRDENGNFRRWASRAPVEVVDEGSPGTGVTL